MTEALKAALVRIRGAVCSISGTGFLAADCHIVTCAHVVAQALGCAESQTEPPAGEVSLDFPHSAPQTLQAGRVIGWRLVRPDQPEGTGGAEDIAVLELSGPPPPGCRPARLINASDLWGHGFRSFGFPTGADSGGWTLGVCRDSLAGGWVQIEDTKETGYRVAPGCSGGPVWDEQASGVIGMVVAADRQATVKAAFIIPAAILGQARPELAQQAIPPCPYRGLIAFREQDAPYFFGRKVFVQQLVEAVHGRSFVAVLGASGSGESSVVFAGLVPCLRSEEGWVIASFRPGDHPFRALASSGAPAAGARHERDRPAAGEPEAGAGAGAARADDLRGHGPSRAEGACCGALLAHRRPVRRAVYAVFRACRAPEVSRRAARCRVCAPSGASDLFHLVLTMRVDFDGHALSYCPFADVLQDADLQLGPMAEQELREAIEKPAYELGVAFEEGLVERILEAVRGQPGRMPLLQFALTVLWAGQVGGYLTHETSDRIGGVERALAG